MEKNEKAPAVTGAEESAAMAEIIDRTKHGCSRPEVVETLCREFGNELVSRAYAQAIEETQSVQRKRDAEFREQTISDTPDYRRLRVEHDRARSGRVRFMQSIVAASRHAKAVRKREADAEKKRPGWEVGAVVWSTLPGPYRRGEIVKVYERGYVIMWDTVPGIPIPYFMPWEQGVRLDVEVPVVGASTGGGDATIPPQSFIYRVMKARSDEVLRGDNGWVQ